MESLLIKENYSSIASKLLHELQLNNIRIVHWKSTIRLEESIIGKTDLDILIHPIDKSKFEKIINNLNFKRIISQKWSSYENVDDWLGYDVATGVLIHLHAHYTIVTGMLHVKHIQLPWIEYFLQNTTVDKKTGWPIPIPELESIVLFIRIWAKTPPVERLKRNPTIPKHILDELRYLLKLSDLDKLKKTVIELKLKLPDNFSEFIYQVLNGSTTKLIYVSKFFYNQIKRLNYSNTQYFQLVSKSFYYKTHIKLIKKANSFSEIQLKKKLATEGKVIAVIGSDGSGKSTLCNDLIKWLSYKLDITYLYLGIKPHMISNGKIIKSPLNILYSNSNLIKRIKRTIGGFYFAAIIKKKVDLLIAAQDLKMQGRIVLCDRFPQRNIEGYNDGPYLQTKGLSVLRKYEKKMFDQISDLEPDVVFRLNVDSEVAINRKPGHSKEAIHKKCKAMDQIVFNKAKVIEINANRPYDEVLSQVKFEIWQLL